MTHTPIFSSRAATLSALCLLAFAVSSPGAQAQVASTSTNGSTPVVDLGSAGSSAGVRDASIGATEDVPLGELREVKIDFAKGLGRPGDVTLVGIHAFDSVNFGVPDHWTLEEDPVLHMRIARSDQLIENISAITVWVDGRPVHTVELDDARSREIQEVDVPLDLRAETGFHSVTFLAYHRSRLPCELSNHPGLWSRVLSDSYIKMNYREEQPELSLANWPYPFRDQRDPNAANVVLVVPENPTEKELQATAYISSVLGKVAGWRPMNLTLHNRTPSTAPKGHLIVIGSNERPNAALRSVQEQLLSSGDARTREAGNRLSSGNIPGAGILALTHRKDDPRYAVLGVIGRDDNGLVELARLLSGDEARRLPTGLVEFVDSVPAYAPLTEREWTDTVPPETSFTLSDLGLQDRMTAGYRGGRVRIPLNLIPDDKPVAGAARFEMIYSYSAQADTEHSRIDVYLNGAAAGGVALRDVNGRNRVKLLMELPVHEMGPESYLDIAFTLVGKEEARCLGDNRVEMWGTVHSDSRVTLPRDRWAVVPQLEFVRFGGFPMGLKPDFRDTLFVMEASPSSRELQLFVWLAAELGRVSRGTHFSYAVQLGSSPSISEAHRDKHLIVVDGGPSWDLYQRLGLVDKLPFKPQSPPGVALALASSPASKDGLLLGQRDDVAYIQQVTLDWNKEKTALLLYAPDETLFQRVGYCADGESLFDKLEGQMTRIHDCEDLAKTEASGRTQTIGTRPVKTSAYEPIRSNYWPLVTGIAIGIIFVLAVRGFWLSLGRRRDDYEDDGSDEYKEG